MSLKESSIYRRDKADGVLTAAVLSMLFILMVAGLAIDLVKNQHLKSVQDIQTQQATSTAVKTVDSRGSLGPAAAARLAAEYIKQKDNNETAAFRGRNCDTRDVPGVGVVQSPYLKITLEESRKLGSDAPVTFIYKNGSFVNGTSTDFSGNIVPNPAYGRIDPAAKYRVISVEAYDSVNNLMLGMAGMPCQKLTSLKSSIAFGDQEDLLSATR